MKHLIHLLIAFTLVKPVFAKHLNLIETRIKWNYEHGFYERSLSLSKKNLYHKNSSGLVNYCYATSLFKIKEKELKYSIVDKVLHYLKISKLRPDEQVSKLAKQDSSLLSSIKTRAILLSEEELKKYPQRAIKRLETIIAIYGDTAEIYKVYILEEQRAKELKTIKQTLLNDSINIKNENSKQQTLVYTVQKIESKQALDTLDKLCETLLTTKQKQILKTAFQYDCVARFPNKKNNPQVLHFFHDIGFTHIKDDETSWCAAFVNFCLKANGYDHSRSLVAKDWLKTGIATNTPQPGDVVIFWREKKNGWQGHVAFFIKEDKVHNLIYAYGGNQGGSVCLKAFPKNNVLAYRKVTQ